MSATTPRTISNAPDLRQLLAAVGALILAVALLVAVTVSRQASFGSISAPAAVPASVANDHGWSSASGSQDLVVSTANGGIVYTGIPYARPTTDSDFVYTGYPILGRELLVRTENGGIRYMGIPYPASDAGSQGGANGTRFPR
jgi:hypothetical protein